MSKKIIAILTIATILFVCVFAACDKKDSDSNDNLYVTDENGERVLADDGQFLVYETNSSGEIVTDESGENVTSVKMFEPNMENGVLEDYGFKLTIPKGWKQSEEDKTVFEKKDRTVSIRLVKKTYDDYIEHANKVYSILADEADIKYTIEENADLVKGADKAFRLTVTMEGNSYISTIFLNNRNLYNVTLTAPKGEADIADMDAFLAGFEFKPYTYYPELTAESTEETAEETVTEATTK